MSWEILFVVFVFLIATSLLMGQWIAFALGSAGIIIILLSRGLLGLSAINSIVWNTTNNYLFIAVPLFLLMGEIMQRTGVTEYFYRGMGVLLRWLPGGLLHANIGACSLFAAISGSSVATAATIGTVAIPQLERRKYSMRMVYGSIAGGGTLGILIPPSIPFILYGALVDESITHLFMAGVIPGLLLAAMFSGYILIRVLLNPGLTGSTGLHGHTDGSSDMRDILHVLPILALLGLVLGGIYSGLTTPTESAAVGAFGALALGILYRRITRDALRDAIFATIRTTGMVMLIVISAQILSTALTFSGVSRGISEAIYNSGLSKWEFFATLVVLYIVLGCFVEGIAMIYLTLPILYPVIQKFGFDPIWFGVVLVVLIEVGQIHPPLGINLFTIKSIAPNSRFQDIVLGSLPYVFIVLALVLILALFPDLALWLPRNA
jgi:tripartite ATP-independent transporter DctM subunit